MKYTEPGTYELTYIAIDECGNETIETRQIIVEDSERYGVIYDRTLTIARYDTYIEEYHFTDIPLKEGDRIQTFGLIAGKGRTVTTDLLSGTNNIWTSNDGIGSVSVDLDYDTVARRLTITNPTRAEVELQLYIEKIRKGD